MAQQTPRRLACAWGWWERMLGFSYSLQFDTSAGMMDKVSIWTALKCSWNATSIMYLNGCRRGLRRDLEGARFQVREPERGRAPAAAVAFTSNQISAKTTEPRRRTRLFLLPFAFFMARWIFD